MPRSAAFTVACADSYQRGGLCSAVHLRLFGVAAASAACRALLRALWVGKNVKQAHAAAGLSHTASGILCAATSFRFFSEQRFLAGALRVKRGWLLSSDERAFNAAAALAHVLCCGSAARILAAVQRCLCASSLAYAYGFSLRT
jgi:hypothetical protein